MREFPRDSRTGSEMSGQSFGYASHIHTRRPVPIHRREGAALATGPRIRQPAVEASRPNRLPTATRITTRGTAPLSLRIRDEAAQMPQANAGDRPRHERHFLPDGKQIVFHGVPRGSIAADAWDVFLWRVDGRRAPQPHRGISAARRGPEVRSGRQANPLKQDGRDPDHGPRESEDPVHPVGGARGRAIDAMLLGMGNSRLCRGSTQGYGSLPRRSSDRARGVPSRSQPNSRNTSRTRSTPSRFFYVRWTSRPDITIRSGSVAWMAGCANRSLSISPGQDSSDPYPIDDRLVVFSSTRAADRRVRPPSRRPETMGKLVAESLGSHAPGGLGVCYDRAVVKVLQASLVDPERIRLAGIREGSRTLPESRKPISRAEGSFQLGDDVVRHTWMTPALRARR